MAEPLVKNWELYTTSMKCGKAERSLNAALNLAAKKLVAELKRRELCAGDNESISKLIAGLRDRVVGPVMEKYRDYGATDTEPYYQAGQGLVNAAKDYFGIPRSVHHEEWGDYL
jgi:hypothetical protein